MAFGATIRINIKDLEGLNGRWGDLRTMLRSGSDDAKKTVNQAAQILVGEVRDEILSNPTASTRFYSVRTGALARSYRERTSVRPGSISIGAESDLIYARIQDLGGRIFPKTGKRLAIPMLSVAAGKWPRHFPRGELFRRGSVLSRRVGGRTENVFMLLKSVRIKPKHYTRSAMERAKPQIAKAFVNLLIRGYRWPAATGA